MVRADKAEKQPASMQPLEQSLLRAKARTQVIETEYQRMYVEEEKRMKYVSELVAGQQKA